ncbi:MAG: efflux RND transporter permease subunit [Reinekea sp.]
MNIGEYFISHKVTSWMITLVLIVGGTVAFLSLGQLEDPEFTIKQMNVVTQYPGASAEQVEEEVTFQLETEIQQLPYIDKITSYSQPGMSVLEVAFQDTLPSREVNQAFDEVRKKIRDLAPYLPSDAETPVVIDDFADVYGVSYALYGEGFTVQELSDVADYLNREISIIDGIAKVEIAGEQIDQVAIELSYSDLSALGLSTDTIAGLLAEYNVVSNAGYANSGTQRIRIRPTGELSTIDSLGELTLVGREGNSVKLKDIATIRRVVKDPSNQIITYNGHPAINIGVSFASGSNVVDVGDAIQARLKQLSVELPAGISLDPIYEQPKEVSDSVKGFLINLAEAVAIVIVVLLLFVGIRSGVLIGLILLLTILGTFIFMMYFGISLQRVSLGGLIIALGMLVDNAIVVSDGILVELKLGKSKLGAAGKVVKQNFWPLLGATVIAITAFAPIGLSPDKVGEYVGSLFYVLLISLFLSWVTAITLTPFFCDLFMKEELDKGDGAPREDPYKGVMFSAYKLILKYVMHHKWLTSLGLVVMLALAVFNVTSIKQSFFPDSATPLFFVELRYSQGTSINVSEKQAMALESYLEQDESVAYIATTANQGFLRFMLTYTAMELSPSNVQMVVRTKTVEQIEPLLEKIDSYLRESQPEVSFVLRRLALGPSDGAKIEAKIVGQDSDVLREIADQYKAKFRDFNELVAIRDTWKQKSKVYQPVFDEAKAIDLGITKGKLDQALLTNLEGRTVGVYRDGTDLLPIVITVPEQERDSIERINDIQVYAPYAAKYVSFSELVTDYQLIWEDARIVRENKRRTLAVQADMSLYTDKTADQVFKEIRPVIEAIALPDGYSLEWGGEYEDSGDAQKNVMASVPLGYLFMFIITVLLFNSIRESLIVWFCVPLTIVGIVVGMLSLNIPFGFMSLLGFLSLSGMVVKNGIVLIEQINHELAEGVEPYHAVFNSAVSRVRPVMMAAATTILGLVPLLFDPFFQGMSVVIAFGLGFATVLTLLAIPVFYLTFFRIKVPSASVVS